MRVENHVFTASLAAPGGQAELNEFLAQVLAEPVDKNSALWELWILDGHVSKSPLVFFRVHHAMADGLATVELFKALTDDLSLSPLKGEIHDHIPSRAEMLAYGLTGMAFQPLRAVVATLRTFRTLGQLRASLKGEPVFRRAPRSPFNATIGSGRTVAVAQVSFEEASVLKERNGVTLNEVILTVCSGALRRYLAERDSLPDSSLVAFVPVSIRAAEKDWVLGNRLSGMLVEMGSHIEDPAERLKTVAAASAKAKRQGWAGAQLVEDWAELASPLLTSLAARIAWRSKALARARFPFNVVISNLRGPQQSCYLGGLPVTSLHVLGPVTDGVALNITLLSYDGTIYFGLVSDPGAVDDIEELAKNIPAALEELQLATGAA